MTQRHSVTRWLALGLTLSFVGVASQGIASAQTPLAETQQRADQGDIAAQETLDVSRLPLNLNRIQRALHQSAIREERHGLNLRYVVEVYGQAPPIVFFGPETNLAYGPVPYGAPTHREMIEHVTPKEYRAPAAHFSELHHWLRDTIAG